MRLRLRPVSEPEQDCHGPEADEEGRHARKRNQNPSAADPVSEGTAAFLIGHRFGRLRGDGVLSLRRSVVAERRDMVGRLVHERDPACIHT
jgi:hypothetical protein